MSDDEIQGIGSMDLFEKAAQKRCEERNRKMIEFKLAQQPKKLKLCQTDSGFPAYVEMDVSDPFLKEVSKQFKMDG